MSTRSSLYSREGLHVYHEMHDRQIHMELTDGDSYSFVNVILTEGLWKALQACLVPDARV